MRRSGLERLEPRMMLSGTGLPSSPMPTEGESVLAPAAIFGKDVLARTVDIPTDLAGAPGGTVAVPINIDDAAGVGNVYVRLAFDTAVLDVSQVRAGSLWPQANTIVTANVDEAAGTIIASVFNVAQLDPGQGSLFEIDFTIAPNPPGAKTVIDLQQIDLNEGAISVDPNPEVGSDTTDGLITFGDGVAARVDTSLVFDHTSTDAEGEVDAVPDGREWIDEWDSFWIEVWVSTPDSTDTGVATASIDLGFNAGYFSAGDIQVEPGPAFDVAWNVDVANEVVEIEATTSRNDVGDDQYGLVGRVRFVPAVSGPGVPLLFNGDYSAPVDNGFHFATSPQVILAGNLAADMDPYTLPSAELWPVMYDMDDTGMIDLGDLAFLASAYRQSVTDPNVPSFVWKADFDRSDTVDLGDLAYFAVNFGRERPTNDMIFPTNFPDAWHGKGEIHAGLPEFATAEAVQADGTDIGVEGDTVPTLADGNSDGTPDLIDGDRHESKSRDHSLMGDEPVDQRTAPPLHMEFFPAEKSVTDPNESRARNVFDIAMLDEMFALWV
ncbi:MAG: cohesin domain-containing protein [Thermoguttaceae bacterium]